MSYAPVLSHSPLQTNLLESMELEVEMVLLGANLNLSLAVQATSPVNSFPIAFTAANIPILVATLATNIWAIYIIQRKETSRINRCPIQIPILANNSYLNAIWKSRGPPPSGPGPRLLAGGPLGLFISSLHPLVRFTNSDSSKTLSHTNRKPQIIFQMFR